MATSSSSLAFSLCLLVLFHGCVAQFFGGQGSWQVPRGVGSSQRACRFETLSALEPSRTIQSEAGVTEYYEEQSEQLQCAGLSVRRRTINPRGLRLPSYSNAPALVYITQGRGVMGLIYPGCPETYQSFQQQFEQSRQQAEQIPRDEHQKIHRFRQGDVIALPAGVTHWFYNDGDVPLVAITVFDIANSANQLEPRRREFFLAGSHQSWRRTSLEQQSGNILRGFDTQLLAEALGVNQQLVRRLQSQNDQRGEIVHVQRGLQVLRPSRSQEFQQEQEFRGERYQGERTWEFGGESCQGSRRTESIGNYSNGLDENFCTMKIRQNIDNPSRADFFNPRGGRVTIVNSQKLPILNNIQMSAGRVVLRSNALLTPFWHINAHSLMYVTGGQGRVQIVNNHGRTVFDGQLTQRQILLIPQNFAVLKRASRQGFEWVSFKTNQNAMVNKLFGKNSAIRSIPSDVLRVSYRLSTEQAWRLKNSRREEMAIFAPRFERSTSQFGSQESESFQRDEPLITEAVDESA
ncbi:hypothetical protein LUZ60_008574 [Juncus effusus]|nr:hypothetical protein LUZ60_008574 [Juncus effusus]